MSDCSILRIGPVGSDDVAALRCAIASHFHRDAPVAVSSSGADASSNQLLSVSNRYFDARVLLLGLHEPRRDALPGGSLAPPQEDGVVLVFDAALPLSFDALGDHHSTAVRDDRCGEVLRLCVGVAHGPSPLADGSKRSEGEYSRRVLWCLDHGYEYAEVDLTPEGMARGFDKRDKEGFARVIEAISTSMWSSRVMKERTGRGAGSDGGASVDSSDPVATSESRSQNCKASQSTRQSDAAEEATGETSSNANDADQEKSAVASLMQGINDEQDTDTHKEAAFHQLEQVLSEAKRIREASKNETMSDQERRQRAGDTAVKLMGVLGDFGLGGDDTEDESPSSQDEV